MGVAECWNQSPGEAVDFVSLDVFNKQLYELL